MYITYEQLLALPTMKDVKVVAGESGLYRGIQWTQVLEFDDIEEWVGQGALIWVTGVAMQIWEMSIDQVVEQAIRAKASGMVIYLGAYIKTLPPKLLDICNENQFPLLVAPKEVKIVEVSYQIAEMIFANQKRQDKVNDIINDVYMNKITDNTCYLMENIEFQGAFYRCLSLRSETNTEQTRWNNVQNIVTNYLEKNHYRVIAGTGENSISAVLASDSRMPDETQVLQRLAEKVEQICGLSDLYELIGEAVPDVRQIGISMRQALYTYEIVKRRPAGKGAYWYRNLGVYRLICSENIETARVEFANDYLGELLMPKNRELLETLAVYIRSGQNMTQAADTMFIHINTMKYRIKKIEQMLDCSLKDVDVANCIYISLAICETQGIL